MAGFIAKPNSAQARAARAAQATDANGRANPRAEGKHRGKDSDHKGNEFSTPRGKRHGGFLSGSSRSNAALDARAARNTARAVKEASAKTYKNAALRQRAINNAKKGK